MVLKKITHCGLIYFYCITSTIMSKLGGDIHEHVAKRKKNHNDKCKKETSKINKYINMHFTSSNK